MAQVVAVVRRGLDLFGERQGAGVQGQGQGKILARGGRDPIDQHPGEASVLGNRRIQHADGQDVQHGLHCGGV